VLRLRTGWLRPAARREGQAPACAIKSQPERPWAQHAVSLQRAQEPADAAQHNPFEGNPALAVAYAAALAAIEGAGQGAPSLPRLPERGPPLLPPLPFPSLCQQPLLYMPAYSLVGLGTRPRSTAAPYLVRRRVRSMSPRTVERSTSSVPSGCTCSWAGLGVKQSVDMPTRSDGRFWSRVALFVHRVCRQQAGQSGGGACRCGLVPRACRAPVVEDMPAVTLTVAAARAGAAAAGAGRAARRAAAGACAGADDAHDDAVRDGLRHGVCGRRGAPAAPVRPSGAVAGGSVAPHHPAAPLRACRRPAGLPNAAKQTTSMHLGDAVRGALSAWHALNRTLTSTQTHNESGLA